MTDNLPFELIVRRIVMQELASILQDATARRCGIEAAIQRAVREVHEDDYEQWARTQTTH